MVNRKISTATIALQFSKTPIGRALPVREWLNTTMKNDAAMPDYQLAEPGSNAVLLAQAVLISAQENRGDLSIFGPEIEY